MRKKGLVRKRKLQLTLEEEVYRNLKIRAVMEMTSVAKLVEKWVKSWEEKKE